MYTGFRTCNCFNRHHFSSIRLKNTQFVDKLIREAKLHMGTNNLDIATCVLKIQVGKVGEMVEQVSTSFTTILENCVETQQQAALD